MINRAQLLQQLEKQKQIPEYSLIAQVDRLLELWQEFLHDTNAQALYISQNAHLITNDDSLCTTYSISAYTSYTIVGIDGSQVYPDRHRGTLSYLINIGMVQITYHPPKPAIIQLTSQAYPYLVPVFDVPITTELVTAQRQHEELKQGVQVCTTLDMPVILYDGSLMQWHLQHMNDTVTKIFAGYTVQSLQALRNHNAHFAYYTSLPGSSDMVSILQWYVTYRNIDVHHHVWWLLNDTQLVAYIIPAYHHSVVFKVPTSSIIFPADLQVYYFYIHTGTEIARVEIPAYIAQDVSRIDYLAQVIIDQCDKGHGYPLALAEAHEQAVVSHQDREFFYWALMQTQSYSQIMPSHKLMRKKRMYV